MSNASMKEQLQAVASKLSDALDKTHTSEGKANFVKKMKKPKQGWLDYVQYGVELLKAYFPSAFKTGHDIKPLKKGIKQDLVIHLSTLSAVVTEDKACMVKSLGFYVNTAAYHRSVIEGATRIDLEGNPSGIVSAEEARYSMERQHARLQSKANHSQPQPKIKVEE